MANPTIERANLVRLLSTPNVAVVLVRTTIQGQIQVEAIGPGPLDRIRVLLSPNGTQNLIDFAPGSWWLNSTSLFSAVDNGFIDVITESSVQTGLSISLELQYIPQPPNPVIGDLLVFNGIGWDKLPAGPIGQVLTSNGPATVPSYQVNGSGSVTSVTALLPLSTSGTATDPVVEFQAWPADAAGALTNDGSGTLSWVPGGTGAIGGTIAATQVAFGTALDTIGGSSDLSWNANVLEVNNTVSVTNGGDTLTVQSSAISSDAATLTLDAASTVQVGGTAGVSIGGVYTLPAIAGVAGEVLTTDGLGGALWAASSGGAPGTPLNSVQFNSAGSFGGSAGLTWDGSTLAVDGSVDRATAGTLTIGGTTASAITVGKAGVTTSFPGPVALNGTVTSVVQTQFVTAAQFDGNVTFGNAVTDNVSFVSQIDTAITQEGIAAPAVSPLTTGRIYFDSGSNKFRVSQNNGAYVDMLTGGTVTSVTLAASTTGLTISGGASQTITSSGTFTLGGTLAVANGGTGTATAFTPGSVVFAGASGAYAQDNNNLFWDDTNNRLRIGFVPVVTFSGNLTLDSTTIALTTTAVCTVQVSFDLLVPSGTVVIDVDTAGSVIARYGTGVTGNTLASSLQAPATVAILTATATAGGGLTLPLGFYTTTTVASSTPNETLTVNGRVSIAEGTVPLLNTTGFGKLWADTADQTLHFYDNEVDYLVTPNTVATLVVTPAVLPSTFDTTTLDFSPNLPPIKTVALTTTGGRTGNLEFATSNLLASRNISVRVVGDPLVSRGVAFPAGWKWLGGAVPAVLEADKTAILSLAAFGGANTDVVASWSYDGSVVVTNVTAVLPLVSSGGTTPAISITAGTGSGQLLTWNGSAWAAAAPAATATAQGGANAVQYANSATPANFDGDNAKLAFNESTSQLSVGTGTANETLTVNGRFSLAEGIAPLVSEAGFGKLWANSAVASSSLQAADARPYWTDDTGQSYNLTLDRFNTLAYGLTPGSVAIDTSPALPVFNSLALSQNTTFTTSNLGNGRSASVRVVGDASTRTLTFPSGPTGWTWLGSGPPASLAAGDVGYLSITAYGTADTDVVAAWSSENQPAAVVGSGVDNQISIWSGTNSQDGSANLTFNGTTLGVTGGITQSEGAVSLTADAASSFSTTTGDLTLDAAASLILDGGEAADDAVRIVASNAAGGIDVDAGTAGVNLTTTGLLTVIADGGIDVDALAPVNVDVDGDCNISTSEGGGVFVSASGSFNATSFTSSSLTAPAWTININSNALTWPIAAGTAGQVLTNSGAGAMTWAAVGVAKPTTTVRSNDASPTPDPNLVMPVGVGIYKVQLLVEASIASDVPGLSLALFPLNGAVLSAFTGLTQRVQQGGSSDFLVGSSSVSINGAGSGGVWSVKVEGTVTVTTAGDLGILWSQITSSADAVSLVAGSSLIVTLLG